MKGEPDFLQNLRNEVGDGRQWLDRAIVLTFAVLAGLAVVGFTLLADAAFEWFGALRSAAWWAPLLWTPAVTALVVWAVRRWGPAAAGSGVPQVMCALAPEVPASSRGRFVSLRLSAAKVLGVSGGLLAGLSIGRQGPSVQASATGSCWLRGARLASRRRSTPPWVGWCLPLRSCPGGWSSAAAA